ncbi:hypothetical protein BK133_29935 [Paenibacillus sp. FSL H8-0548]|nr:hypothetical protein BK133_29935 [Paenibacillus sp. FSL H8-0548]
MLAVMSPPSTMIATVFILNLRHFLMSAAMVGQLTGYNYQYRSLYAGGFFTVVPSCASGHEKP